MHVNEPERHHRGGDHGIDATTDRALGIFDGPSDQALKIFWAGANVIGKGLLSPAVVSPDESTVMTEAQPHESRVADDDALEAFQFSEVEWMETRLADGFCPPCRSRAGWPLAFDRERRFGVV